MTAEQAIARSVSHNEIVTFDASDEDTAALILAADDWVKNGDLVEYWGKDDEGNEWRVHTRKLVTLAAAREKLEADGYSLSGGSNDERLILALTTGESDAIESVRELLGADYSVEFTGDGNTDRRGVTTDDVRISIA